MAHVIYLLIVHVNFKWNLRQLSCYIFNKLMVLADKYIAAYINNIQIKLLIYSLTIY